MSEEEIEVLTEINYESYCAAVGGIAFNGDPLPTWEDFSADPNKAKQAQAWRGATAAVIAHVKG